MFESIVNLGDGWVAAGSLELPFPPSVNHYWLSRKGSHAKRISDRGMRYRTDVIAILFAQQVVPLIGRLALKVDVYPPDRRRRDLDNICKALLDALEKGGLYKDDEQIDVLYLHRRTAEPPGRVVVHVYQQAAVSGPQVVGEDVASG